MVTNRLSGKELLERVIYALVFIALGGFIIIVFNPWGGDPLLGKSVDYLAKLGMGVLLLVAALLVRRSKKFHETWQILFALFILTVTVSLERVFGIHLLTYLGLDDSTPIGWALPKLNELIVVASIIITLTLVSGESLGSIYVQKGNLKLGLTIGLVVFFICVAGSLPMTALMFRGEGLTFARALPWTPWVLIFVLANGAMEELMFRGLFLKKLEPFFGRFISNLLIALVFTVMHRGAYYTSDQMMFLVILFPLALLWGYLIQKTDSLWSSILFHAGTDIPIILGILANLP
jgi:hypothetical protein